MLPSALQCLTSVFGMGTGISTAVSSPHIDNLSKWILSTSFCLFKIRIYISPRIISISKLNTSPCLHTWPINVVVYNDSYPKREGRLILKLVSHLDAFSVYPFDTLLPCCAAGATTGPQEVSPLRSSRTRSRSSQSSYGHDR